MRVVDQETGEELEDTRPAREPRGDKPRGPRRDGAGGGGGRGRDGGGRGRDGGGRGRNNDGPKNEGGGDIPLPSSITED